MINVSEFLKEIKDNEAKGMAKVTPERLRISDRAHIVFPMHMKADGHQEEQRKNKNEMLGTTKKGIGTEIKNLVSKFKLLNNSPLGTCLSTIFHF